MSNIFDFCYLLQLFSVCHLSLVFERFMLTNNVKIAVFSGHAKTSKTGCSVICLKNSDCCKSSYHGDNRLCLWHQNCSVPLEYSLGYITLSKSSVDGKCPDNYLKYGDHCYYFGRSFVTWYQAKMICLSRGEILAEPETRETIAFLKEQTKRIVGRSVWLGGMDQYNTGTWVWDTSREVITTSDWYPGQPKPGNEPLCLLIKWRQDYFWVERPCTDDKFFICQTSVL